MFYNEISSNFLTYFINVSSLNNKLYFESKMLIENEVYFENIPNVNDKIKKLYELDFHGKMSQSDYEKKINKIVHDFSNHVLKFLIIGKVGFTDNQKLCEHLDSDLKVLLDDLIKLDNDSNDKLTEILFNINYGYSSYYNFVCELYDLMKENVFFQETEKNYDGSMIINKIEQFNKNFFNTGYGLIISNKFLNRKEVINWANDIICRDDYTYISNDMMISMVISNYSFEEYFQKMVSTDIYCRLR